MIKKCFVRLFFFCFVSAVFTANAQVVVSKAGSPKCALDLSGFRCSDGSPEALFRQVLEDDLKRSGWFDVMKQGKGSFSVQGTCREAGGNLTVRCQVDNILNGTVVMSKSYDGKGAQSHRRQLQASPAHFP